MVARIKEYDDETIERLFGAEDAESERPDRFKQYFFFNQAYLNLSADLPIRILVGHKGVGKSALLRRLYLDEIEKGGLAVNIQPNDIKGLWKDLSSKSFNEVIEEWKVGIEWLIAEKAAKEIAAPGGSDLPKRHDGRISSVVELLKSLLPKESSAALGRVAKTFLATGRIIVFIDDIDRGWSASQADIRNISALLNAIRDMSREDNRIKFCLGIRSDVYYLVRTSDESTDKIERNVIWLEWSNHEVLCIAAKRILTFFGDDVPQDQILAYKQSFISSDILSKVIEPTYTVGRGHWDNRPIHNVLLSLTRRRPRDLVKLFHGAGKRAFKNNHQIISSGDLEASFERYSDERLQDIINEFRSELPALRDVLLQMRPTRKERTTAQSFRFKTDQLVAKIRRVRQSVNVTFANGKFVTERSLLHFLYKIDFIQARLEKPDGSIERRYFDQSRFLADEAVDFGYSWEIHPAYRWALQPNDIQDVIDSLD